MDTATGKPVAAKEESGDVDLSESETESGRDVTRKLAAFFMLRRNPLHPVSQIAREVQKLKRCHNSSYGNSILSRQEDLRTRT